jgi:hypothetical protein
MGPEHAVTPFVKDEGLDRLAEYGNVAQFVSFDSQLNPRYSRISKHPPNERLEVDAAVRSLIGASPEGTVNVRSFKPNDPQGNEFIYGISNAQEVVHQLRRLTSLGFFVIANETVDVKDGGVSGVTQGSVIEFAPGGTPRVVDNARPVSLRLATGLGVLSSVYGFTPDLEFPPRFRIEFSIHPVKRGWRNTHTIIWEIQELDYGTLSPTPRWPNDFSEFVGDKAFGLLVADGEGYLVPKTTVMSRHLPSFSFGQKTGSDVVWIRTSPKVAMPGRFRTIRGWADPFKLLATEDPDGTYIPSVLVQDEVYPQYSGALLTDASGEPIIEGVPGSGEALMLGGIAPAILPTALLTTLTHLHDRVLHDFGPVRLEWVFDGEKVWVVQLQQEAAKSVGTVIVDGDFTNEITFRAEDGLERLRTLTSRLSGKTTAIRLVGNVGMTSHMADVLRRTHIPSRLVRQ